MLNVHRNHKAYWDWEKGGRGYGGGGRGRSYTYRYTVTTWMTSALRWATMRAILMFHDCDGQSHKTVSTDPNFWREKRTEADSNRSPSAYQPNALPLGQTGSQQHWLYSTATISVLVHSWCTHRSSDISGTDVACSCKLKEDHRQPLS